MELTGQRKLAVDRATAWKALNDPAVLKASIPGCETLEKTDDNDNQRWSWDGNGDERRLKAKHSGLVLDANADGKVIQKKADEKSKTMASFY